MNSNVCLLLGTIRNAGFSNKRKITIPYSGASLRICNILYKRGVITYYKHSSHIIEVGIKYFRGLPVIRKVTFISRPSRRLFFSKMQLMKSYSLQDFVIVSTEKGLLSSLDTYILGIGGQVICKIN